MGEEFTDAALSAARHVVRREAATGRYLRPDGGEIVRIPFLVRVRKHEVERTWKRRHELVRVAKTGINVGREAGFLEVRERVAMSSGVDLDRQQLSASLAERPGDPDA